jgi:NAD+ kinase
MKKFLITGNHKKKAMVPHVHHLLKWLSLKDVEVFIDDALRPFFTEENFCCFTDFYSALDKIDFVLAFGGDGTILYTAKRINHRNIPMLGLNLGGLGFLADIQVDQITSAVEYILHDEYSIEKRDVLQIESTTGKKSYAFNDIVFDKAGFKRVIEIQVYIDNTFIHGYVADGLILSTPTGSTAYNLSAGGPIIVPNANVKVITPICPHSLTARPIIVPMDSELKIRVNTESEQFICNTDGQEFGYFASGTEFTVIKAPITMDLLKIKGNDIYTILRGKLKWGEDFRNKKRWSFG